MTSTQTLLDRNRQFAGDFSAADLPLLPKLRAVLLTCIDARVDPAYVLGLELGEVAVIRNNGGRVTPAVIDEIAVIAFLAANLDCAASGRKEPDPFELIIMHHTQCGAEMMFADPQMQGALKEKVGVDVSSSAISDHEQSLRDDIERLRSAANVPGYIVVSGLLYDPKHGSVREVIAPAALGR